MEGKTDLTRFVKAQEEYNMYEQALREIRAGQKQTHWIWFIFPQLRGIGKSYRADFYGIEDMAEAKAYLAEPTLCARLVEICEALLALDTNDAYSVMNGSTDQHKLRSSMTLFSVATDSIDIFDRVLVKFFNGKKDHLTLQLLGLE